MIKKFLYILALFIGFSVSAQDIPEKPNPPRLVNDFGNVLNPQQIAQLEGELTEFARQTSTQVVVVTVPTLDGYDASDYAFQLGEKWGVGKGDRDNGVVVLFKPKTANEKGQVFVAVGYGLEGIIPDATANRDIVNNEMIPRFQVGDIYGGLYNGVKVIMALAAQEYSAGEYHEKVSGGGGGAGIIVVLFAIIFIFSLFRRRRGYYTGGSNLPLWLLMGSMMSSGHNRGGSFGNFSGGGGSFGGGGGFGGFGGGGFGGGGAGGSW
ncbi:MAG: YgcG family protein [Mangrovibacterium sp.]